MGGLDALFLDVGLDLVLDALVHTGVGRGLNGVEFVGEAHCEQVEGTECGRSRASRVQERREYGERMRWCVRMRELELDLRRGRSFIDGDVEAAFAALSRGRVLSALWTSLDARIAAGHG